MIIIGDTGSGKSTQLPRFLLDAGWCNNGYQVVVTQPRRIAAVSLAERVAYEHGTQIGSSDCPIGYTVRNESKGVDGRSDCHVKFVTDGVLVREVMTDATLQQYSVVMVDEAHERNINVDLLCALLKKIIAKRPSLRVVISSATIDAQMFQKYFDVGVPGSRNVGSGDGVGGAVVISVDGRAFPVETMYLSEPCGDYVRKAAETVLEIHHANETSVGDILVFLPTSEDIDRAIFIVLQEKETPKYNKSKSAALKQQKSSSSSASSAGLSTTTPSSSSNSLTLSPVPLHGSLPLRSQLSALSASSSSTIRKAVFSTPIAETSLTVPNVRYVVDSGYEKIPFHDPKRGIERMVVTHVSRASATQRKGRAGRTAPGQCYRLYPHSFYTDVMSCETVPEISRTNLSSFVLSLKSLGVDNVLSFDLLTSPSVDSMVSALEELYALGALDGDAKLTLNVGRPLGEFPTEPREGRMLLSAITNGCEEECIAIVACLQGRDTSLFVPNGSSASGRKQRYEAIARQVDWSGEHVTYAKILCSDDWRGGNGNGVRPDADACRDLFLNVVALSRADEIRNKLRTFLRRLTGVSRLSSCGTDSVESRRKILRAVCQGLPMNVAVLAPDGKYRAMKGREVVDLSPQSVLALYGKKVEEYVVYSFTEETTTGGGGGEGIRRIAVVSGVEGKELRKALTNVFYE